MNKKYSIYAVLIMCLLSCKKKNIETYNGGEYVQFTNSFLDTVNLSFFFYPNQNQVSVTMPVKLVGNLPATDLNYKIEVDKDATTALPEHYTIAPDFIFKKGRTKDSATVVINRRPDLTSKTFQLALVIKAGNSLIPGQSTYTRRIFKINDMVSKPAWWNADCERIYLGKYTEKKFRAFMQVVGIGDISTYSSFEQRDFFLQFKYYLIKMKDAGTPVLENDGTDMLSTVPLIG